MFSFWSYALCLCSPGRGWPQRSHNSGVVLFMSLCKLVDKIWNPKAVPMEFSVFLYCIKMYWQSVIAYYFRILRYDKNVSNDLYCIDKEQFIPINQHLIPFWRELSSDAFVSKIMPKIWLYFAHDTIKLLTITGICFTRLWVKLMWSYLDSPNCIRHIFGKFCILLDGWL